MPIHNPIGILMGELISLPLENLLNACLLDSASKILKIILHPCIVQLMPFRCQPSVVGQVVAKDYFRGACDPG